MLCCVVVVHRFSYIGGSRVAVRATLISFLSVQVRNPAAMKKKREGCEEEEEPEPEAPKPPKK